jgi:glutamate---cysteine ligase / carboxylate-amine ligase
VDTWAPPDEVATAEPVVAERYDRVLAVLDGWPAGQRAERVEAATAWLEGQGAVFTQRVDGEDRVAALPVDLVPRILSAQDWQTVADGVAQRARALELFCDDVYGERAAVRDGVIPGWLVRDCPGLVDVEASGLPGRRLMLAGLDVLRGAHGRWLVLEDNVQVPSGLAYALLADDALAMHAPEVDALRPPAVEPVDHPAALGQLLADAVQAMWPPEPASGAVGVLLSDGPANSAWYEHGRLSVLAGLTLVTPDQLEETGDGSLAIRVGGALTPVAVVYRRIDAAGLRAVRLASGRTAYDALLTAVAAGTLSLVNALGSGVADDKAVYSYLPALVDYYLDERPLLDDVPTWVCGEPEQCAEVLARLDELVCKPVDGFGGAGLYFGRSASDAERAAMRQRLTEAPHGWVAQEPVAFSTHPTVTADGGLGLRHVDLRVFAANGTAGWRTLPNALTRVALREGSLVVNSSAGGGTKSTWLAG